MTAPQIHIHVKNVTINAPREQPMLGSVESILDSYAEPIQVDSAERFTLLVGGQIVTDHKTGLMWPVYESDEALDYEAAEKYAADLRLGGFDDWRLPEIERRLSITDYARHAPALFVPLQSRSNSWEWTRTPVAWRIENGVPRAVWQVHGSYGYVDGGDRDDKAFARPCRFVSRPGQ